MADALLRSESPTEFFRELVEDAMENQRVSARELTSFYVVNLLAGFVHGDTQTDSDEPLGPRLARALQTAGVAQRDGLRKVGDQSLFFSGFFSDSFNRGLIDIDYYIQLGERAYRSLARRQADHALGDVFDELSDKFTTFVDVLGEVSERTSLSSNSDVLRLYEKWLRTRSRRSGDLLAARGIVPNHSIGSRFIQ